MITDTIRIRGARENNLKDVSLDIPKYKITVFTGVSGSGKSSLVLDTIAAKSRRELNDTFPTFVQQYLPKYGRPHVDSIEGLPIAVVIDQKKPAQNSRSTVGTYTDIYALMRLLFSRVGKPFVGYSDSFSFNHPQGSCPRCSGLGEIRELDIHKLVDFDKSLNDEDTIHYIAFGKGGWRWIRYAHSGLFDLDKKIKDYSPEELDLFLNLRAAGTEFQHRPPFRGAADAAGLGGDQALVVKLKQHIGFQKLRLDGRRPHGDDRLSRENGGSFGNCPDITVETEVLQRQQEFLIEHPAPTEVFDVFFRKMQVLDIIDDLLQSSGNGVAALVRDVAEKDVEVGDPVLHARFPVPIAHGQFIKIAEHGQVDSVCRSHCSQIASPC